MCNDYEDLLPLVDSGELSAEEEARLWEHLRACPACCRAALRLRQVPALLAPPAPAGWAADVAPAVRARLEQRAGVRPQIALMRRGAALPRRAAGPPLGRLALGVAGALALVALFLGLSTLLQAWQHGAPALTQTVQATIAPTGTSTALPTFPPLTPARERSGQPGIASPAAPARTDKTESAYRFIVTDADYRIATPPPAATSRRTTLPPAPVPGATPRSIEAMLR